MNKYIFLNDFCMISNDVVNNSYEIQFDNDHIHTYRVRNIYKIQSNCF